MTIGFPCCPPRTKMCRGGCIYNHLNCCDKYEDGDKKICNYECVTNDFKWCPPGQILCDNVCTDKDKCTSKCGLT